MRNDSATLQQSLSRRLMPLVYGLVAIVALILALTWGALQVQVTLAGFLNGESIWSKSQKQAVIELQQYAVSGAPANLDAFRRNYATLMADRSARDAMESGHFDRAKVTQAFTDADVIPRAIPGMIFILNDLPSAPYIKQALEAWHSTDTSIDTLGEIALELQQAYAKGGLPSGELVRQRGRILALNSYVEPRTKVFSLEIARGASWIGRVLFISVLVAAILAMLLWLGMARRVLASVRGSEERYRLLFDSAADAIVMIDEGSGRILDVNRTASTWIGRTQHELVGDRFVHLFVQSLSGEQTGRPITNTLLGANGGTRPVETQTSMASWGNTPVRQAIIRDISERVALEQERRVAAEALASIAEGVIIADAGRQVISINAALTQLTGFSSPMLQGRRLDDMRRLADGKRLP
ncbi:MAG: PAS domain S-box protein, partial [Rhodanobacter sp.]